MLNAIRYMARSGGGWRMLPTDFGPWQTVYWWFRRFVRRMLFQTIHDVCLMLDREAHGREASPSGGVLDSQTVKAPHAKTRGYDANKKIVGRKRHIAVDTDGRLLMVNLTTAGHLRQCGRAGDPRRCAKALALAQAPVRRRRLRSDQTARQGGVQGLRAGDRAPLRQRAWLRGLAALLGRRAHIRLDDTLAQAGARLRGAPGRVQGHDPRRNGKPPPAPDRTHLTILKRTLETRLRATIRASISLMDEFTPPFVRHGSKIRSPTRNSRPQRHT